MMTPRLGKFTLTAHIIFSIGWFGAVAAYLAVAIAGLTRQDALLARAAYFTMELIGWYVIVPAAIAALATGLVQALGTQWGLFRHYWILAKLLLTIASIPILLVHMQATSYLSGLAAETTSTTLFSADLDGLRSELVERAVEALLVLLVATTLAVCKPWGRTRYWRRRQTEPLTRANRKPASG
jgi:hypothetical protein